VNVNGWLRLIAVMLLKFVAVKLAGIAVVEVKELTSAPPAALARLVGPFSGAVELGSEYFPTRRGDKATALAGLARRRGIFHIDVRGRRHHPNSASRAGSSDPSTPYCTAMFLTTPILDQKVPISSWPPFVRFAVNLPCVFKPEMDTFPKALPDTAAGNSFANAATGTV
jgi:hypothetical protein